MYISAPPPRVDKIGYFTYNQSLYYMTLDGLSSAPLTPSSCPRSY